MTQKEKVVVAMSGGVDSSVAAALLKEQGYDVIGMMLRLWSEPGKEGSNRCCTPESMALARLAAAVLGIPFYVIDAKDAFQSSVVQPFLDGYGRGETPNPCLECNRQIRWTFLLEHALSLGAGSLATGHYARTDVDPAGRVRLLRAVDRSKDQSYVLHVLTQDRLRRAMFPIGEYRKSEVRALAESYALPMAARHDSQDLCFLAGGDYRDFLRSNRPEMLMPGEMVDLNGRVLGEHTGLPEYTIGQRKGIRLSAAVPMYVLHKDVVENRLVVGPQEDLGQDTLVADRVNWTSGEPISDPFPAQVKTRYTATETPGVVHPVDGGRRVEIVFDAKQRDITPGQAAVFYVDGEVLGGGIIQ